MNGEPRYTGLEVYPGLGVNPTLEACGLERLIMGGTTTHGVGGTSSSSRGIGLRNKPLPPAQYLPRLNEVGGRFRSIRASKGISAPTAPTGASRSLRISIDSI